MDDVRSATLTTTEDFLKLLVQNIKNDTAYDCTGAVGEIANWLYSAGNPVVTVTALDTTTDTFTQVCLSVETTLLSKNSTSI